MRLGPKRMDPSPLEEHILIYDGTSKILPFRSRSRSGPRTVEVQFTETDGMKCAEGHIPEYKNQIPFDLYSRHPARVCLKNGPNRYLVWDNTKSKYCCQPEPDSNRTIMERSLQNIYNMVTKSDINYKSLPSLKVAIDKYLRYYDLVNNDDASLIAETEKMNTLKIELTRELSRDYEEKSQRDERGTRIWTHEEANRIFKLAYPDVEASRGGRSKKHKSKSRTNKPKSGKPKSKSKRTKSRKPKSRKSKRRY